MQRFQARFVDSLTNNTIGMSNVYRHFSDMPHAGYYTYTSTGIKLRPKKQSVLCTYAVPLGPHGELVVVTYFC